MIYLAYMKHNPIKKISKNLPSKKEVVSYVGKNRHTLIWLGFSFSIFILGVIFIWLATLKTPDFNAFNDRVIANSTKIYDRTGEVLLYDIHEEVKRNVIPFEEISKYSKDATVAIEDSNFYYHKGIEPKALMRAVFANLKSGQFSQGGSTITQQIVKNTLLTQDKKISRKLKEWILAVKVEKEFSKEQILAIYLNEAPYGGSIYGIKEASLSFFGVDPLDVSLAQSAYLAAIPNAPTFYSPYGKNKEALNKRKDLVLSKMIELGFITKEEGEMAMLEEVEFLPKQEVGIKAPHFVFWVREYLESKYGEEAILRGGLIVKTTLDYDLQQKGEEVVKKHADLNNELYGASNAALVSIDPKTGQVLSMVGSKDYFDEEIDGNFNIATAFRQPGSSFKPFVYATAMEKGFEPESVVFDVKTEFNPSCGASANEKGTDSNKCYNPQNYDGLFVGPITLRNALAQSRNIPAVKLLYLVGIGDAIKTAQNLGISSLTDPDRYGLTLVLGGGEVQLIEMVSAYGVFATEGVRNQTTGILEVKRQDGEVLESYKNSSAQVLNKDVAIKINSILSDNVARTPLWGSRSFLYFPGYDVAGKTGTTDNKVDAWIVGYSPDIVTGVWSGNNDNTPMKQGSGISGSLFGEYMSYALTKTENNKFTPLTRALPSDTKPIIRGQWLGGFSAFVDSISGGLATEYTPKETTNEIVITNVHSELYWIDKTNPTGNYPENPGKDNQYKNWEYSVQNWWNSHKQNYPQQTGSSIPTFNDNVHTASSQPVVSFVRPLRNEKISYETDAVFEINFSSPVNSPLLKIDFFMNDIYIGTTRNGSKSLTVHLNESSIPSGSYELKAYVFDQSYNKAVISLPVSLGI